MPSLVTVQVRNGDLKKALSVFKKKVANSGHLIELKGRQEYLKPSVVKRLQKNKAVRARKKQERIEREW